MEKQRRKPTQYYHQLRNFHCYFLKARQPNRLAYNIPVGKKQKKPVEAQRKWIADCGVETQENIDWDTVYRLSFLCTIKDLKTNCFPI